MNLTATPALLLALLLLLLVVAFSSGTEVAMLSVNRYRIRHRAQGGSATALILERLLERPDEWLGANLVILAAASTIASAIATILADPNAAGFYERNGARLIGTAPSDAIPGRSLPLYEIKLD